MTTLKGGIQLVPPLPVSITEHLGDKSGIPEIIAYRNRLIETRNAQLEYQQNITNLHTKIRAACHDLSKKDNHIKGDIETLAKERGRLAHLRDELARRADVISRWEFRLREESTKTSSEPNASPDKDARKEQDRRNALLVEMDQKRKGDVRAASIEVLTNKSSQGGMGIISTVQLEKVDISNRAPVSEAVGNDDIYLHDKSAGTDDRPLEKSHPIGLSTEIEATAAPRPYPAWAGGCSQDQFLEDMTVCLDYLWKEYSTDIGEDADVRLMTLPNLLRLAGDADLNLDTQILIELFLRTVKLGKNCLVEKRFFLALLQAAATVKTRTSMDSIQTTDFLFSDYLFPLLHRLKMRERILTSRHPPLPRSPVSSRSVVFTN